MEIKIVFSGVNKFHQKVSFSYYLFINYITYENETETFQNYKIYVDIILILTFIGESLSTIFHY